MHSEKSATSRWAAKSPYNVDHRASFVRHVQSVISSEAAIFEAKDADELDREICDGRFDRVVFDTFDDLLETIWNEDADFARWTALGVQIEILKNGDASPERLELLREIHANHVKWRTKRKRRRLVAATILSFIGLIAMAILFTLAPFTR